MPHQNTFMNDLYIIVHVFMRILLGFFKRILNITTIYRKLMKTRLIFTNDLTMYILFVK